MGLIVPSPPNWTYHVNNWPSARSANVPQTSGFGTSFTCGANNAKGSTTSVLSALTHDVQFIRVGIGDINLTNANGSALVDLMIDYAGGTSWSSTPLVPNLMAGYTDNPDSIFTIKTGWCWFAIPVFVPAGASIGVRGQVAHTSTLDGECIIEVYGGNSNPGSAWCASAFEQLGINTGDSGGASITPGASNSFGSWTNVGSTLSNPCKALICMTSGEGDSVFTSGKYYEAQFGINNISIGPSLIFTFNTAEYVEAFTPRSFTLCRSLPAGTQLQCRMRCHTISPENVDVGALALR